MSCLVGDCKKSLKRFFWPANCLTANNHHIYIMKTIILVLSSLLCFNLAACKSKAKSTSTAQPVAATQPTTAAQPTVYKGVTNDSCAVEMAFGSYGSGIDGNALDAAMAKINEKHLKHSAKSIGREGEIRLCMPLTELKDKEKNEFIEQLKKIAATGQLVSVSIR
jgi:hypothetical protein